jgi:hypothetical protein
MAVIHHTTLVPSKLELLADWVPAQPWYRGTGRTAELAKAGGFRLDDPQGEVGMEFMAVTDTSGEQPVVYQVPMTYRGAPLAGAEAALIGTTEHGVLGRRWIYDGAHDPVLVGQLLELLRGRAVPQAQSATDTADPTVVGELAAAAPDGLTGPVRVGSGPDSTEIALRPGGVLRIHRVLRPGEEPLGELLGQVTAGWPDPTGETVRGRFAALTAGAGEAV